MTGSPGFFNTDGGIHRIPLPERGGGLWLCGKHYVAPRPDEVRAAHGIDTVVCLVRRHELEDRYDDYVRWLDSADARTAVWHPIDDMTYPPVDDVIDFLDDLVARTRTGATVLVHCAAGIGRAGTTAVSMLMMMGMDASDAIAHVAAHRPGSGPQTLGQSAFVQELAGALRR